MYSLKTMCSFFLLTFLSGIVYAELSTDSDSETTKHVENQPIRKQGKTRFNYAHKAIHFNVGDAAVESTKRKNLRDSSPVPNGLPYQDYAKPDGIITTYDVQGNACQFPQDMYLEEGYVRAAISMDEWNNGANCGKCYKLIGKGTGLGTQPFVGEHDVIITNLCPECPYGHFDLLQDGNGIWDIEYYETDCKHHDNSTPKYKAGTSTDYYLSVQIIDTPSPVVGVYLTENPDATLEKTWDNHWVYYDPTVLGNGVWQYPVTITANLENGEQRTGQVYPTGDYQDF